MELSTSELCVCVCVCVCVCFILNTLVTHCSHKKVITLLLRTAKLIMFGGGPGGSWSEEQF